MKIHIWTVIGCLVIIPVAVTVYTLRLVPVYQATARLQIEKENPNILSFQEVMELDANQTDYYQTQYENLKSRTLARGVIDSRDLIFYMSLTGLALLLSVWSLALRRNV